MRAADRAWVVIGVGVLAYEVAAALKRWELLSTAMDRYIQHRPILARSTVAVLSLHLVNVLPERVDPIHLAFVGIGKVRDSLCKNDGFQ